MAKHAVFIGEREHSLDKKNRAIIPSKFRDLVDEKRDGAAFFLSVGLDGCLYLYTQSRWNALAAKIRRANLGRRNARAFQRRFFGTAEECLPDSAGRILIPEHLKKHAALDKDVVFVGVGDRIEIWSKEHWGRQAGEGETLENLAEEIFGNIEQ